MRRRASRISRGAARATSIDAFAVGDENAPLAGEVIAADHLEDRRLADAGRAAEHDAFAGRDAERDAVDDRQPRAAVQVQGEGLGEALDPQQFVGG